MRNRILKYAAAAAILCLYAIQSAAIPAKPYPPKLVNDFAGLLDTRQRIVLEQMLDAFSDSTSNQIAIVTVNDLEGYSPAEYGTEIGLQWQVGSSKFDNGIVVLVKPKTADSPGQVNISIGYGLEGAIPDSYAKRIIDNEMIPEFMQGDYYTGISNACTVLMKLASGEISEYEGGKSSSGILILLPFLLIFIIAIIAGASRRGGGNGGGGKFESDGGDFLRGLIIGSILSNTDRHSGDFGGGGFSGGFGGGFGGFGGGSFGGGGASGSW